MRSTQKPAVGLRLSDRYLTENENGPGPDEYGRAVRAVQCGQCGRTLGAHWSAVQGQGGTPEYLRLVEGFHEADGRYVMSKRGLERAARLLDLAANGYGEEARIARDRIRVGAIGGDSRVVTPKEYRKRLELPRYKKQSPNRPLWANETILAVAGLCVQCCYCRTLNDVAPIWQTTQ